MNLFLRSLMADLETATSLPVFYNVFSIELWVSYRLGKGVGGLYERFCI